MTVARSLSDYPPIQMLNYAEIINPAAAQPAS
jgi:hypothetical protein